MNTLTTHNRLIGNEIMPLLLLLMLDFICTTPA